MHSLVLMEQTGKSTRPHSCYLLEHITKVQEKQVEDHPSRLASQHALAGAYEANGQVDEAELIYQRALIGREKALDREQTLTLDSVNNFNVLFGNQSKLKEKVLNSSIDRLAWGVVLVIHSFPSLLLLGHCICAVSRVSVQETHCN